MTSPTLPTQTIHFGPFTLNIAEARLTNRGAAVALRPKAFEVLATLALRPNELVTKDELLDSVWGRRFITEGVIKSIVAELRSALGDDPKKPQWIETVPKRGYRFVGATSSGARGAIPLATQPLAAAGNVPGALPDLIGRDDDLVELSKLLGRHRLLTIAGPSGVGKTRLALALAAAQGASWRDGVWLVELAALASDATDVRALCATFAQRLRLNAVAANDAVAMAWALKPLHMLLILDNAEHLLEPLALLADTLLAQAPLLSIVVTSQEPLRVAQEQVFRLSPLTLPSPADESDPRRLMASSAVRLFVERVVGRMQGFGPAPQQQHAIASICRALDGMPLALELAAARVPLLGVNGVADLLLGTDDSATLHLLTDGSRASAPRHRTLRNAIQWSYDLLDEPQRQVFRRLGVFRGGFSVAMAQAVCEEAALDRWAVLRAVGALVEKSLLVPIGTPDEPRFTLLESLRGFAMERLAEAGEEREVAERHLQAVIAYWSDADATALGEPGLAWTAQHLPELENLRAALRWARDRERGACLLRLLGHTVIFWYRSGLGFEGVTWCEVARLHAGTIVDSSLLRHLDLAVAAFGLYSHAYPKATAMASAQRAAEAFESAGDCVRGYFAFSLAWQLSVRASSDVDRRILIAKMQSLEEENWNDLLKRFLRLAQGYELRLAGDSVGYLATCGDELAMCRRVGAVAEGWVAAQGVMLASHDAGQVGSAIALGRETLDEIRRAGRMRQNHAFFALWTTMLAEQGFVGEARIALEETLPVLQGARVSWMAQVALAWLAAHEQRMEDSARLLGCYVASHHQPGAAATGGFIDRTVRALSDLVRARIGSELFQRLSDEGCGLSEEQAERVGLAVGTHTFDPATTIGAT